MLAHEISVEQIVEHVRAGLASVTTQRVVAGDRTIEVVRVKITDAGRRVLARREL
jgi:hypothetical protein